MQAASIDFSYSAAVYTILSHKAIGGHFVGRLPAAKWHTFGLGHMHTPSSLQKRPQPV
jgi:hypothetical protein